MAHVPLHCDRNLMRNVYCNRLSTIRHCLMLKWRGIQSVVLDGCWLALSTVCNTIHRTFWRGCKLHRVVKMRGFYEDVLDTLRQVRERANTL